MSLKCKFEIPTHLSSPRRTCAYLMCLWRGPMTSACIPPLACLLLVGCTPRAARSSGSSHAQSPPQTPPADPTPVVESNGTNTTTAEQNGGPRATANRVDAGTVADAPASPSLVAQSSRASTPPRPCGTHGTTDAAGKQWVDRHTAELKSGIDGTVVDKQSSAPIHGAVVELAPVRETVPEGFPSAYQVTTDAQGRFSFCLTPGAKVVLVVRRSAAAQPQVVLTAEGKLPEFTMPELGIFDVQLSTQR